MCDDENLFTHTGGAYDELCSGGGRRDGIGDASIGLASIYGLRMLGLFIILPVFTLYAQHLPGGESHLLMGVALGAPTA